MGGYLVEAVEEGTRFTLEANTHMPGWGILMSPLVKIIGGKMNKADVTNLKKILETRT
ncbi:hypothetical protein ACFL2D_01530 [Patescibacteria group bacterium]